MISSVTTRRNRWGVPLSRGLKSPATFMASRGDAGHDVRLVSGVKTHGYLHSIARRCRSRCDVHAWEVKPPATLTPSQSDGEAAAERQMKVARPFKAGDEGVPHPNSISLVRFPYGYCPVSSLRVAISTDHRTSSSLKNSAPFFLRERNWTTS